MHSEVWHLRALPDANAEGLTARKWYGNLISARNAEGSGDLAVTR